MRLDVYMVKNNLVKSREKASLLIKRGSVEVDGNQIQKPSFNVELQSVTVTNKLKYVSRGGEKLEKAIAYFALDFNGLSVLDIGSSTGGFTDCSLQHGASIVYSVDVGKDQLDDTLKADGRVKFFENTDIRRLAEDDIKKCDIAVTDVSFISLKNIIPCIKKFTDCAICLIKPQFEVGKIYIKNGVVKDEKLQIKVLKDLILFCENEGFGVLNLTFSPIKGGEGNIEFLVYIKRDKKSSGFNLKEIIAEAKNSFSVRSCTK